MERKFKMRLRIQPITTDFEKDNFKAVPEKFKTKEQKEEELEMKKKKKRKKTKYLKKS